MTALDLGVAASADGARPRPDAPAGARAAAPARTWLRDPLVLWLMAGVAFLGWAGLAARYVWLRPTPPRPIGHVANALLTAAAEVGIWAALTAAAFETAWRFPLEPLRARTLLAVNGVAVGVGVASVFVYERVLCATFGRGCTLLPLGNFPLRIFSGMLFAFYAVAAVGYGLRYAMRHRQHEIASSRLEAQLARARLDALQAQIHPHFLFNTLHSVSALVARDPDAAEAVLDRLTGLLSLTLERAGVQEVTLVEELGVLEMYAGIERVRFSDRLRLEMRVEPGVERALLPHLLLQPLVENAIRHGIAARPGPGRVSVSARAADGRLVVVVEDDGPGPGTVTRGNGVGLANTRARLRALHGDAHDFRMRAAEGGGTVVTIALPLRLGVASADPAPSDPYPSGPSRRDPAPSGPPLSDPYRSGMPQRDPVPSGPYESDPSKADTRDP